jgi:hypothetical protein
MNAKTLLIIAFLCITTISSKAQYNDPNISTYWDNYYNNNPSGIEINYQATDFINAINLVSFKPKSNLLQKSQDLLKKALLMLDQGSLKQMSIDGNYYSRIKKHDDYFALYNLVYEPISKSQWDRICPYLIPIMSLDNSIKLNN